MKVESSHYVFNVQAGSYSEEHIDHIIDTQEQCYKEICQILSVEMPCKIQYFLCDTPEIVGEIYGDHEACNGFAEEPDKIYAVYNGEIQCIGYHEDAHIISYGINRPPSVAVREGLAMMFDRVWWGIDNDVCTSIYIESNEYVRVLKLVDDELFYKVPCEISYPIVGSFTKYLIERFGMDKYLEFYKRSEDTRSAFKTVYGCSISEVEEMFINIMSRLDMDEEFKKQCKKVLFA